MIILTQQSGGTFTAQIRSAQANGFKVIYRASCTESEAAAARAVVYKFFGHAASKTVTRVPNDQVSLHVPITRRSTPASVWTFNHTK